MIFKSKTMSALLSASLLACAHASAATSTLVVGTTTTAVNYVPFSNTVWQPEYQQIYAASDFATKYEGSITIDDILFYVVSGAGTPNNSKLEVTLSTTSAKVGKLNANLFEQFWRQQDSRLQCEASDHHKQCRDDFQAQRRSSTTPPTAIFSSTWTGMRSTPEQTRRGSSTTAPRATCSAGPTRPSTPITTPRGS